MKKTPDSPPFCDSAFFHLGKRTFRLFRISVVTQFYSGVKILDASFHTIFRSHDTVPRAEFEIFFFCSGHFLTYDMRERKKVRPHGFLELQLALKLPDLHSNQTLHRLSHVAFPKTKKVHFHNVIACIIRYFLTLKV